MDGSNEPALLNLRRMAAKVGVTQRWLRDAAESGRVPGLYAGGRWVFDHQAVTDAVLALARDSRPATDNHSEASK